MRRRLPPVAHDHFRNLSLHLLVILVAVFAIVFPVSSFLASGSYGIIGTSALARRDDFPRVIERVEHPQCRRLAQPQDGLYNIRGRRGLGVQGRNDNACER